MASRGGCTQVSVKSKAAREMIEDKPLWLIGSPPCTDWCTIMNLNWHKMDSEEVDAGSALNREIEIKIQELAVLIDKIAVNQTNIEGKLSSLSRRLTDGVPTKGGANSEAMEKALAKVEQRVGDLYTIEKARIAREIADLRTRRDSQ